MTKFIRGDRVRVITTRYGMEQYNTVGTITGTRNGQVFTVDFDGSPKKAPTRFNIYTASDLAKVQMAEFTRGPVSNGLFMVSLLDMKTDELHPNKKPKIHHTREAAEQEASRLAKKYGGTFIVLQLLSGAHRPVPVTPPVTTFKF